MTFWSGSESADPCLWLIYPDSDPGGPKTCGSGSGFGSGSATLIRCGYLCSCPCSSSVPCSALSPSCCSSPPSPPAPAWELSAASSQLPAHTSSTATSHQANHRIFSSRVRRGSVRVRRGSVRVRCGSDSSASGYCKAAPSSNLGSVPQWRRPSTERTAMRKIEWSSANATDESIECMCVWNKDRRVAACHQTFIFSSKGLATETLCYHSIFMSIY